MREMSPGAALRELEQAQAGLRKARDLLKQERIKPGSAPSLFNAGWDCLVRAHRVMAAIPSAATDDSVLTKQLAVQRYATALLVRLRRFRRHDGADPGGDANDDDLLDGEDRED